MYCRAFTLACCFVAIACGSGGPTTPTPTPSPAPAPSRVSLSGRIFDAGNGVPVAGNVLILRGTNQGRSTHADAGGNYRLSDLQPGTFTVFAGLTNYSSIERETSLSADTTLDFPLTLLVATLSGRVTDTATGAALPGATLAIIDGANVGRSTTSAADGTYRFTDLLWGGFTLRVRDNGYDSEFRAVRMTADTTLDVQMRPAMQSLAGTWTGTLTYAGKTGTAVSAVVEETTMTHEGASIGSNFIEGFFSGTLRDPSAISPTTQVTGTMTVFYSEGFPRAPTSCNGTGSFTGTVNWTRLVLTVPAMPLACGGSFTNVTLSLIRQQ